MNGNAGIDQVENASYTREVRSAWCAVLAGAVLAVVVWWGRSPMNVVYTWVPQAVALGALFLLCARPAALSGAALAFAGYPGFFHWRVFSNPHPDGLAWLFYLFSLPGGLLGGLAAIAWLRKRDEWSAMAAGLFTAVLVIAGIALAEAYWFWEA